MQNILLVYPKFPVTYWGFQHIMSFIGKKAAFPPLALITIAAWFKQGFRIKLVDCNIEKLRDSDLAWADYVLTSSMIVQKDSLHQIIARCNQLGKPVVCGGPYPTSSPERFNAATTIVIGEAEPFMEKFVEDIRNNRLLPVYKAEGDKPELSLTPKPRFDLVKLRHYSSMLLQFSRGCPFNCEFCDIIEMFGRTPRTKSPAQFLAELDGLYDTGFRGKFFIVDDNFIGNKTKVKAMLAELIGWQRQKGFPFQFYTEASVNLAQDEELLQLMTTAGFSMVFLGLETPDENTLKQAGKNQNTRHSLEESIHKIQNSGLEVTGGFIVGFDSDPENIFELQKTFIQKAAVPFAMVGLLMALPLTQLTRRLTREGRMRPEESTGNNQNLELNFIPKRNQQSLVEGYRRLLMDIYHPKNYFRRCRDLILHHLPLKRAKRKFRWQNFRLRHFCSSVRALIYSLIKQGFSRYGLLYYRYLLEIAIRRPSYFVQAVTFAVYGHHFFRITRDMQLRQAQAARPDLSNSADVVLEA